MGAETRIQVLRPQFVLDVVEAEDLLGVLIGLLEFVANRVARTARVCVEAVSGVCSWSRARSARSSDRYSPASVATCCC